MRAPCASCAWNLVELSLLLPHHLCRSVMPSSTRATPAPRPPPVAKPAKSKTVEQSRAAPPKRAHLAASTTPTDGMHFALGDDDDEDVDGSDDEDAEEAEDSTALGTLAAPPRDHHRHTTPRRSQCTSRSKTCSSRGRAWRATRPATPALAHTP